MHTPATAALAALALFITSTTAHSWVEEMDVIDPKTGTFTGTPGYCRNNTKRTVPGFSDPLMVHILPSAGQPAIEQRDTIPALDTTGVYPNDTMCKHTQQSQYQSNGSPRLQAAAGDLVALRYQENGHVSLPSNQPGKPANRGTVYIYGTSEPKFPELFLDVFGKWTADGTGGDGRGRLLATQNFDDGRCYQVNGGNISTYRQAHFPHTPNELMGANLWCQSDIALPTDLATGKPFTVYYTWNWPTEPNVDPALPKGKAEIYTTCMDIDIVAKPGSRRRVKARQAPQPQSASLDLNSAAIPAYVSSLIASPAPAAATAASGAVSAQSSPSPAAASVAVSAQSSPSPASPESAAAPAAGVSVVANAGSDSMTNAGVSSYIMNAVSAAIVAEAPKVPLTITVDIVDASTPMTAGAVVATQSAAAAVPAPVASPAYVATSASPAPSPAVASAPTQSASPAASPAATPAAASSPSTVIPSSPAQAPAMAPSSLPPKSLAINPPVLSAPPSTSTSISSPGFSGTASPVVASPAAEASSTSASVSPPGFSGTATPVAASPAVAATSAAAALANSNSTSPVMSGASQNGTVAAKGQCQATTCKSKRQSKILGQKGGSRRLLRV